MPRRKAPEVEEDEDYDPNDSFDDGRRVKQKGSEGAAHMFRSSRGRPVKVCCSICDQDVEQELKPSIFFLAHRKRTALSGRREEQRSGTFREEISLQGAGMHFAHEWQQCTQASFR